MVEMLKCEICGKFYPKGTICCGVGAKNEPYLKEDYEEPQFGR